MCSMLRITSSFYGSLSFSMTKENMELYSEKKNKTKTPQFYSEAQTEKTNM